MDTFELLIYHTAQEDASIEVVLKNETIWATQKAMAQLFGIQVPGINKHVNNILREGELQVEKVISKMETTTAHGAIEGLTQTYAMIQNKFHYAISGQTAAEIVYERADATKEHMGLTTWQNAPEGRVLKSDVSIAKNYLDVQQIRRLERAVSGYFDYIEDLIENENTFTMVEFANSVNEFLSFRKFKTLPEGFKGRISHEEAVAKAEKEYDTFNRTQRIESDFDKAIKQLKLFEN